jgi:hypothetical protein
MKCESCGGVNPSCTVCAGTGKILEEYLGDGVYVSFDGYSLIFDLRGQDTTTKIAMEPAVFEALQRWIKANGLRNFQSD